jgi:chaperonin GroES
MGAPGRRDEFACSPCHPSFRAPRLDSQGVGAYFSRRWHSASSAASGLRASVKQTQSLSLTENTSMAFRPLGDRVLVRRIEEEEKTKGGIIIPDTAKEKPQEGKVIAVGPGGRDDAGKIHALDLKAGDRILFGKWSGSEIKLDGEDLLIMKESDVLGVLS